MNDILLFDESQLPPVSLDELARIRGGMWTTRLDVPWGPRPLRPDNIIAIDYFEHYQPGDQDRIIRRYVGDRRYTHAPMGPLCDPGYHGQLPLSDWRQNPDVYFDAALKLERAGCRVIHFVRPDRGCFGLDWTISDLERELTPIFRRYQDVMRIVCLGWEPGPRYYYENAWWVEMTQWLARTFPNALRLIHMVSDVDSPVGGNDDKRGISNGQGWANVAPYIHGFLAQYAGYTDGSNPIPSHTFIVEFQKALADLKHRFATGGPAGDWPRGSAWGPEQPIRVYAGEYAAFGDYWKDFPEDQAQMLGQLALAAGADGAFDGV